MTTRIKHKNSKQHIKAVVFDFGGVLVRTETQDLRRQWEHQLGLAPDDLGRLIFESDISRQASIGDVPEDEVWAFIGNHLHLSQGQIQKLRSDFFASDKLDDRLVDFIKEIRPNFITAILSNAWSGARLLFGQTYGLDQVVDIILISAEERLAKPDPRVYERLTSKLGVLPQETIFVDDFSDNIKAAQAAGIQAVLFTNTEEVIAKITALLHQDT